MPSTLRFCLSIHGTTHCPPSTTHLSCVSPALQNLRELSVRRKLNAMPAVFEGKNVLLVDDSIVRGTTMRQIVEMVRRAGAAKVCLPRPSALCCTMQLNLDRVAIALSQDAHQGVCNMATSI